MCKAPPGLYVAPLLLRMSPPGPPAAPAFRRSAPTGPDVAPSGLYRAPVLCRAAPLGPRLAPEIIHPSQHIIRPAPEEVRASPLFLPGGTLVTQNRCLVILNEVKDPLGLCLSSPRNRCGSFTSFRMTTKQEMMPGGTPILSLSRTVPAQPPARPGISQTAGLHESLH